MDSGSNLRDLPLELLEPNPWNPNRMGGANLARLRRELARGFLCPILVRPLAGRYQIVDGEHRFRLARELGRKSMPCVIATLSESEARIKTLQMNGLRGENDPTLLGRLLLDLRAAHDPDRLAALLPWDAAEIESLTRLAAESAAKSAGRILAGAALPPPAREIFCAVLPAGGRARVEAALEAVRAKSRLPDLGQALLCLCDRQTPAKTTKE